MAAALHRCRCRSHMPHLKGPLQQQCFVESHTTDLQRHRSLVQARPCPMAHLVRGQCLLYKGQSSCMCMPQPAAGSLILLVDRFAAGVSHGKSVKTGVVKSASYTEAARTSPAIAAQLHDVDKLTTWLCLSSTIGDMSARRSCVHPCHAVLCYAELAPHCYQSCCRSALHDFCRC